MIIVKMCALIKRTEHLESIKSPQVLLDVETTVEEETVK